MVLDLDAIGTYGDPAERSWTSKDALLYAVAIGAGADPLSELPFTTENTKDIPQQVLPTFVVTLGARGGKSIGSFNPAMLVHAEQAIEILSPLPAEGTVKVTGGIVDIVDKGSGALVIRETRAVDVDTGQPVFTSRSGAFIRGEGGFGTSGSGAAATDPVTIPEREPDEVVSYPTLPQQALLYRLCGDRNPLHSDPSFAARGGFDRPILHGLCTYGFTGRALLHRLCGSDPTRFRSMAGRFSRPVLPGQTLHVRIWVDDTGRAATFQTTTDDGTVVIDRGRCGFT